MKIIKSCLINFSVSTALLFFSSLVYALNTQVTLQADVDITPGNAELVTFGLPIAEGEVLNLSEIKIMQGSQELPAYVEAGLRYHWSDNSIRSVTIQLQNIDMTSGNVTITITDDGAGVNRINEQPHSNGWANAGSDKNNLPYPRIFALHDKQYLKDTGLIPPYLASTGSTDSFEQYQIGQFDNWAGGLNYGSSSGGNWLFDRSSAMFKAYMTTGNVKFLKEAFLTKQFYFGYIKNDGSPVAAAGGDGCFTFGGVACSDGKYIAPQQAKLAWALVGDDSQWDSNLINNMAFQSDIGWNQYATRDTFDSENEGFTERGAGMAGLAEVNAYEMTGNSTVLSHLNQRISSLKDMQQTEKPWDIANGWTPKSGGFTHNIDVHEGNHNEGSAPLGDSNARGFSAWMIENIIDFLWQAYWITGNTDAPEMLKRAANAVEIYGFTSTYDNATGNYTRKPGYTSYNRTKSCNTTGEATDLLYMGSAFADQATRVSDDWWPYYSDTHNIETVLTLGVGFYFETDEAKRTRLASRINKILDGWVNANCSQVFSGVHRLFNWQHRSNSVRTWQWIAEQNGIEIVTPTKSLPLSPGGFALTVLTDNTGGTGTGGTGTGGTGTGGTGTGGTGTGGTGTGGTGTGGTGTGGTGTGGTTSIVPVYVATAACSDGNDPHWQCAGQWKDYSTLTSSDYVAVCRGVEAGSYTGCVDNDSFVLFSSVTSTDGLFVCASDISLGTSRTSCSDSKYVRTANFDDLSSVVSTGGTGGTDTGGTGTGGTGTGGTGTGGNETTPSTGTDGSALITFTSVSSGVLNSSPSIPQVFWAGMPDVNGDGCLDIFIGSHADSVNSNMLIQDNVGGACQGTFTYFADADNYSQASPTTPRITSRYMWGNWYGHPEGFWSFYGNDVDGSGSAKYVLDPAFTTVGGNPSYLTKTTGCYGSRPKCIPLDINGDGVLEMAYKSYDSPYNTGFIVDKNTGATIYATDEGSSSFVGSLTVFDVDNDGVPEVVADSLLGYFKFNASNNLMEWQAGKFSASYDDNTGNHKIPFDYDGDGDLDLAIGTGIYNQNGVFVWSMYQNDGAGNFTDVSSTAFSSISVSNTGYNTTYANSFAADMDLDGNIDIVMGGETFGDVVTILRNNGNGTFTELDTGDLTPVNFGADSRRPWINWGDYDNDGRIDIIHNGDVSGGGSVAVGQLLRNTTVTSNHYLRVRVRGANENTDGLHSRITFFEPGTNNIITHYQVGAFGLGSQNLITHAGLGSNSTVDMRVELPHGGNTCNFSNIAVDRDVLVFPGCQILDYTPGSKIPVNP